MPSDGIVVSDFDSSVFVAKSTVSEGWGSYLLRAKDGTLADFMIKNTFTSFGGPRP